MPNGTHNIFYEDLVESFLLSAEKQWLIYAKEKDAILDPEVYAALIQIFPSIPEQEASVFTIISITDFDGPGAGVVAPLPVLELRMNDTDSGSCRIVFISGSHNINAFLRDFAVLYAQKYPLLLPDT